MPDHERRSPGADLRWLEDVHTDLWRRLERCPTDSEVADALDISVDGLHTIYRDCEVEAPDVLLGLTDALGQLPERERFLLSLTYDERLSPSEIAEVLGVTTGRVDQLHTKAVVQLRAASALATG